MSEYMDTKGLDEIWQSFPVELRNDKDLKQEIDQTIQKLIIHGHENNGDDLKITLQKFKECMSDMFSRFEDARKEYSVSKKNLDDNRKKEQRLQMIGLQMKQMMDKNN